MIPKGFTFWLARKRDREELRVDEFAEPLELSPVGLMNICRVDQVAAVQAEVNAFAGKLATTSSGSVRRCEGSGYAFEEGAAMAAVCAGAPDL